MKWKDLSLKERKQIYDSVRANNPDATYFDIKDAVNFIEDLGKGDYAGAAIDAALNLIPWGVGKTIKKIKKKVGRAIEGTDAYTAESYAEPFTPTITKKKKGKKVKTEADYDQEFAEVKRKYNNMQEYDKELSKITNDLFMPTDGSVETLEKVDKAYGTNYKKAASAIAFQDMANRGKYVKHQQMYDSAGNPIYGRTTGKVDQPTIEDMTISLIKKSKRGTFKAAAKKAGMGVQEYANKVLKKGSKASPAMKKKANFARNAAKWKH